MKYKILGLGTCITALLLCLIIPSFVSNKGEKRYHQHKEAFIKPTCTDHSNEVFCTYLPLVLIDTGGVEIPGRNIHDEYGNIIGTETAPDGQDQIAGKVSVINHEKENNHLEDTPELNSNIWIHVRGNSSRSFDKTNFFLRLVDENGENNSQKMMGMDKHHEWILHGPFLDKTLMRNYMWYNIAGEFMDYAPNVRFCEVFVNGEYQGVYVMMESITAGVEDDSRLSMKVNKKENTYTGYLLRLDQGSKTEMKNIETFSKYSLRSKMIMDIQYPGSKNLTPELVRAIQQDFSDFEKVLYSYDYDNKSYGYKNLIDVDSFVDYYLINEFTCNYDAGWLSTYIYKEIDGKYRMCIWDFNSACDNYIEAQMPTDGFHMQDCVWFFMLIKDEDFVDRIIERYRELRETYLDEEYLNQYIDETEAFLGDAITRNYEKWGYSFEKKYDYLQPDERNPRTYKEAIANMKQFLHERIQFMDENIETLRQYAVESKVKKFNENAN